MRVGQIVIDVAPLQESRDFRWLYSGRLVASAGNVVAEAGASWQVFALTRSPLAVGPATDPELQREAEHQVDVPPLADARGLQGSWRRPAARLSTPGARQGTWPGRSIHRSG